MFSSEGCEKNNVFFSSYWTPKVLELFEYRIKVFIEKTAKINNNN